MRFLFLSMLVGSTVFIILALFFGFDFGRMQAYHDMNNNSLSASQLKVEQSFGTMMDNIARQSNKLYCLEMLTGIKESQ